MNANAASPTPLTGPIQPPATQPVFDAAGIQMQRRMRFNPLRALDPDNLSLALDQFDLGIIRQATLLWDAMIRRDDTLSFVVPQLENSISGKPWAVFKKKNADPVEAARHAAALEYFYANVTATDAFDRNVRGDRHMLLKQMGSSYALRYAVHHFVWKPEPGKMIEVEGGAPVPALSAMLESVPLWFFENTTGTLRFLPFGGFGINGQELDWNGEWMVTTGQGVMFAASICYVFKRLTFQDWTVFNERYAQQKVIAQTNAQQNSAPGQAMESIVANFNGDQGIVLYETTPGSTPPISLLGPEGTVSVDLFERFLDRQDRKMTVMFRGGDKRNIAGDKADSGVSAQIEETEALENAHCAAVASACKTFIDRAVIRYCFGEGVEPLAYFGLPGMEQEDAKQLRESAGFLADRGALVELNTVAERLGISLTEAEDEALRPLSLPSPTGDTKVAAHLATANAAPLTRLRKLVEEALRTANGGPGSARYPKGSGGSAARRAVGKEGDWKSLGLTSAENLPAVSGARPARITRAEAMQKLSEPYAKEDPLGNTIGFGSRLSTHMQSHPEGVRAEFLPHMEATVEHPAEIWHENTDKGPRLRHIGVFEAKDGTKSFAVVSHQLGETRAEVVTGTPKEHQGINHYRKGTLLHASY